MSTLLVSPPKGELVPATTRQFLSNGQFAKPQKQYRREYKKADGSTVTSLRFEGVPVFRSGTFRDSWGEQTEWTGMHTAQMVQHFNFLKDQEIFADVPVRKGHGSFLSDPLDSVIGYVSSLTNVKMASPVDGQKYDYLLADYDILDPEAQAKIDSGLWRNRSAEIGTFVTNSEASYTPTFMGFAYVDVPAVEGLNGAFSKSNPDFAIERGPKEHKHMASKNTAQFSSPDDDYEDAPERPGPPAPPAPPLVPGPPLDPAPVQPDDGSGENDGGTLDPANPPPTQAPVGAPGSVEVPVFAPLAGNDEDSDDSEGMPPVTESAVGPIGVVDPDAEEQEEEDEEEKEPVPVTERAQGPIFAKWEGNHFTIGGRKISPEAGAALINQYQASNVAAFNKEKKDRVTALAKSGIIMAPSLDATLKYAASLGRAQFDEWIALEEAKPPLPLFARQTSPTQSQAQEAKVKEYNVHKEVVAQLRITKNEVIVKNSNAWRKGSALATELNLPWE